MFFGEAERVLICNENMYNKNGRNGKKLRRII